MQAKMYIHLHEIAGDESEIIISWRDQDSTYRIYLYEPLNNTREQAQEYCNLFFALLMVMGYELVHRKRWTNIRSRRSAAKIRVHHGGTMLRVDIYRSSAHFTQRARKSP